MGRAHGPSCVHLKEGCGGLVRAVGGLWGWWWGGDWLAPPALIGLSFSSRTLHLLPYCPLHRSVLCQEGAPELSAGNKRLRKQVREDWSRTESHWRAGRRRQAEACQKEPGTPGQHFSAWPQPHQAWPSSLLSWLTLPTPRREA